MILFFLPIIGFFLYLFFGRSFKKERLKHQSTYFNHELEARKDEQLRALVNGSFNYSQKVIEKLDGLVRMNLQTAQAVLTTNKQISIFTDGKDKFATLFEDIRNAENHIHLEYYIVRKDTLARQLLDLLTQKAKEGVKTLWLYDDVGSYSLSDSFFTEYRQAGGQAEPFMPSKIPIINPNINYRNHRKIVIIDGTIAYTGGFNVGEEYLGGKPKFGYWRDTHLRLTGDGLTRCSTAFCSIGMKFPKPIR